MGLEFTTMAVVMVSVLLGIAFSRRSMLVMTAACVATIVAAHLRIVDLDPETVKRVIASVPSLWIGYVCWRLANNKFGEPKTPETPK